MCGYLRSFLWFLALGLPIWTSGQSLTEQLRFRSSGSLGITHREVNTTGQILSLEFTGQLSLNNTTLTSPSPSTSTVLCMLNGNNDLEWFLPASSTNNTTTTDIATFQDLIIWTGTFWDELLIGDTTLWISRGSTGIFVAGINSITGTLSWIQIIEGDSQKQSASLSISESGIIYNTGTFRTNLYFSNGDFLEADRQTYVYLCTFDAEGNLLTTATYGGQAEITIADTYIYQDKLFVTGSLLGLLELGDTSIIARVVDSDLLYMSFNFDLSPAWAHIAGGIFDKTPVQLKVVQDKLVILGHYLGPMRFRDGLSIQTAGFNTDGFIAIIRPEDGFAIEAYTINGQGNIFPEHIATDEDFIWISGIWIGELIAPDGSISSSPEGQPYGFILRLDRQYVTRELLQIKATGLLSDLIILPTPQGLTLSLNFNHQWQFTEDKFETNGQFEGIILLFETISSTLPSSKEDKLYIYPNPAHHIIHWENEALFKFQLTDFSGRLLRHGQTRHSLPIQDLSAGWYILQLTSTVDNTSTIHRFLKH